MEVIGGFWHWNLQLLFRLYLRKTMDFVSKNYLGSAGHKVFKTWTKTGKKDFFLAGTDFCVFSGHLVFSSSRPCSCSSHRGSKLARIQQWNGRCVLRSVLIASCSFITSIPNLKTDLTLPNCSAYFFPWIFWQTYLIWLGQASFLVICQRVEWQLNLY